MSKEQIDRILKTDFSAMDNTIEAKINSIDQITGKLAQKSNFLAQFQLLLQSEMGSIGVIKTTNNYTAPQNNFATKIQPVQHTDNTKQQSPRQKQSVLNEEYKYPQIKQEQTPKKQMISFEIFNKMKNETNELRIFFNFLKEEIKSQIQYLKSITMQNFNKITSNLQAELHNKYKHRISELQDLVKSLQQKNKVLSEQLLFNPLKELTFQKNNEQNEITFNITKRFKQYQECTNKYSSPVPRHQPIINSQQWKTYRFKFDQRLQSHQQGKFNIEAYQCQTYNIPNLKNISVGVPPIKNGFGVLKSANEVIYRGMWKDGKFNGSGKLNWDGYCYEGNFQNSSFQGYGRLQIKNMVYVGKFKDNKICGEGTLQVDGKRIVGIWQKNKLVRMF